ncbi:MAG: pyrroline-5-carboxylate reductase [Defluviitaleaceae bacterium]|nr:pyrroline-5-carboxylate reductase [Defluviitaleaceae bacterium]
MTHKLGFIGAGNMSAAIISGVLEAGIVSPSEIIASDADSNRLAFIANEYKIKTTPSNVDIAAQSEMIFIAVKPHIVDAVVAEIKGRDNPNALIVSIAAGIGLDAMLSKFGEGYAHRLVITMPNTPAMVNKGMTAICATENVPSNHVEKVLAVFNSIGKTEILPERLFAAFIAIAGSSPAYAYMFIESLADAGVKLGLSRTQAIRISAQAVYGAAAMVLETNQHPATLKDAVCSPGGTTIAAVCELERQGLRNAVISGATAAAEQLKNLGVMKHGQK